MMVLRSKYILFKVVPPATQKMPQLGPEISHILNISTIPKLMAIIKSGTFIHNVNTLLYKHSLFIGVFNAANLNVRRGDEMVKLKILLNKSE